MKEKKWGSDENGEKMIKKEKKLKKNEAKPDCF